MTPIATRRRRRFVQALSAALVLAVGGATMAGAAPSPDPVAPGDDPVYGLANGCYALQSEPTGQFVRLTPEGYRANGATVSDAEPFRAHAAQLGRFMFYGPGGNMLAHDSAGAVVPTRDALPTTDWTLTHTDGGYSITATSNGSQLTAAGPDLRLTDPGVNPTGGRFSLVSTGGCAEFPDSEVNATGTPLAGTGPNGEVQGFIDAHVHMTANLFMGGDVHCGKPFDPQGITAALKDCEDHGTNGMPALLENVISHGSPFEEHDTTGWPTFADWPAQDSLTHEQTYYKWVERAWRGGLRIFTNLLVNNRVLCDLYPLKSKSCNDMDTIRLQAQQAHEMQDYIDAQYGGPGRGWFRIVSSPEQVRRVAAEGKLAVTLGIETSEPFGCKIVNDVPQCTAEDIDRGLDEVYALGVRQMVVTHKFDNAFGGVRFDPAVQGVAVNVGNFLSTGKFWEAEPCTGAAKDNPLLSLGEGPAEAVAALPPGVTTPIYPEGPVCNTRGLTPLGEHMIRGMMSRGMIVDIDHMGVKTADATMKILEDAKYSGVVSSHSWSDTSMYPRIYALGGFVALYASQLDPQKAEPGQDPKADREPGFVASWRKAREARSDKFYFGFGYGADTNGFGPQAAPRASAETDPLQYPYTTFDGGTVMDRQRTGERVFNVNTDGVAQYGLIPDWIADMRNAAGDDGDQLIEDMSRGAEAYLQMWERVAK
ncbi:membrane dipeptidase [Rhodococcus tukisamuensis]|uniref:Membrane dipeptidase (Peptidase family M19) n=1 Tax=Rhodococcus tukisamuensis TaxID=168276 RepID=A0A1G6XM72_9NOCA|nr:membrane dipeptidase [Rhodococcus tukisamuensis]SDD79329.1 Membrane dipeptidase (Peptidase family M19) [Rhodococcus tukisamuensis]